MGASARNLSGEVVPDDDGSKDLDHACGTVCTIEPVGHYRIGYTRLSKGINTAEESSSRENAEL